MENERKISLAMSQALHDRLQERVDATGFESIEEYILFILAEVVRDEGGDDEGSLTEDQEKKIEDTLRGLGYL